MTSSDYEKFFNKFLTYNLFYDSNHQLTKGSSADFTDLGSSVESG